MIYENFAGQAPYVPRHVESSAEEIAWWREVISEPARLRALPVAPAPDARETPAAVTVKAAATPTVPAPAPADARTARMAAWRMEWESSPELKNRHPSASNYAAYQDAVGNGHVRIFDPSAARSARAPLPAVNLARLQEEARASWEASPDLQREFPRVSTYLAWCDADARGLVKIYAANRG